MSRTIATVKRPAPHPLVPDEIDPTTCSVCLLLAVNSVHSDEEIAKHQAAIAKHQAEQDAAAAKAAEAQAAHRRRTGES